MNPLFFTRHVTESIGINRERRPFYQRLTKGESEKAFRLLLTLEYLMIPTAYYYDLRAGYYQRGGVPLLADELISMNRTPHFDPEKRIHPGAVPDLPWKNYHRDLKSVLKMRDSAAVMKVTSKIIEEMALFPQYYPMTRHLVESIHRFAWYLPLRQQSAHAKGLRCPRNFVFGIMEYHLVGLWYFVLIDRASIPVHRQGIPMLTSELPDLLSDLA